MSALVHQSFLERVRLPGSARHLGLVRVVLVLHVLTVLLSPAIPLLQRLGGRPQPLTHTALPDGLERALEAGRVLPLLTVGLVAGAFALVGLATRVAVPVLAACFFLTQNYYYRAANFHDDWLYCNAYLLVLSLAPCGDGFALDAWLRRRRGAPPRDPQAYRWPVEVMIAWFAMVYVAAGLAKLFPLRKGVLWLTGASTQQFAVEFLYDSPVFWLRGAPLFDYGVRWPFAVASVATVVVELSAAVLLVTRRYNAPIVAAILALHAGIYMMGIPGFVQIELASCVLFLSPASLRSPR